MHYLLKYAHFLLSFKEKTSLMMTTFRRSGLVEEDDPRIQLVSSLFNSEYLCLHQENFEESIRVYTKQWFTIPIFEIIPALENLYSDKKLEMSEDRRNSTNFKGFMQGKLIKLFAASIKAKSKDVYKKILYFNDYENDFEKCAKLLNKVPKYLTFFLEYQEYFDNINFTPFRREEKSFNSRAYLNLMIPDQFRLDEIFEYNQNAESILSLGSSEEKSRFKNIADEYTCKFSYLIGYYGNHYTAFERKEDNLWVHYNDESLKVIGNFEDLQRYLFRSRIIPYMVFYQCQKEDSDSVILEAPQETTGEFKTKDEQFEREEEQKKEKESPQRRLCDKEYKMELQASSHSKIIEQGGSSEENQMEGKLINSQKTQQNKSQDLIETTNNLRRSAEIAKSTPKDPTAEVHVVKRRITETEMELEKSDDTSIYYDSKCLNQTYKTRKHKKRMTKPLMSKNLGQTNMQRKYKEETKFCNDTRVNGGDLSEEDFYAQQLRQSTLLQESGRNKKYKKKSRFNFFGRLCF